MPWFNGPLIPHGSGSGSSSGGLTVGGTKADNRVPTVQADGTTVNWEDQTGGSGLSITGTPGDGDQLVYDATGETYLPSLSGAPVYNVKNPIAYTPPGGGAARMVRAAGTNLQTTGTIDVGANAASLEVASATGWATGNGIYVPGAGAAHGLSAPDAPNVTPQGTSGATSRDYRLRALSGDGGWTDCGTITTITTGNATLSTTDFDFITWPNVTGAKAYAVYGDSTTDANQYLLTIVQGQPTALAIQFDAAGYTNAVAADIGKTVVQGTHDGVLLGFDNTARIWWVDPSVWGTDTYSGSGGSVTITTGTGTGTQTSAAALAHHWKNCGAAATSTPYKHLARRSSTNYYVGELMLYPASTSGNLYRCVRIAKDGASAASPPTFSTSLGAETADGDAVFRRENQCVPVLPTTAAAANALTTHVTAISGTTFTLADNATTSVSSQFVMHDDLSAAQAHHAAMVASGASSGVLQWPAGDYDLRPGTPLDDGSGNDARYNVTSNGGNDYLFTLFDCSNSNKTSKEIEWWAHGASIWYAASDTSGRLIDDSANAAFADNRWFIDIGSSAITFRGGRYTYAPSGTTAMEHGDGWNWMFFSGGSTPTRGPRFYGVGLLAWPRLTIHGAEYGPGREEIWDDCDLTYGGSGHDGGWYMAGGRIRGSSLVGIRYDRSLGLYQDDNTYETSLWIHDCTLKNFRQNGIRVRMSGFYFTKNRCFDFETFIDSPGGDDAFFAYNTLTRCGGLGLDDITNLKFVHNTVIDGTVSFNCSSNICNFNTFALTSSYAPTGTTTIVQLSGGSLGGQFIGNNINLTPYTPGSSIRDFLLSGTGNWKVSKNNSQSESVFTFRSTCTGTVLMEGNDVSSTIASTNAITPVAGNGNYKLRDNVWRSGGANVPVQIDAGTIVVIDGDRCTTGNLTCASISGTFEMRNVKLPSATASTFAKAGSRLIDNNFAVAPTISSATNIETSRNRVADSLVMSPTALASGVTNDYALGVCDIHRLDPNASNSTLGGIVARASGTEVTLINVDAGAATITLDDDAAGSAAANRFAFAALVIAAGDQVTLWYDGTSSLWRLKCKSADAT